jgi:hypothetical protein
VKHNITLGVASVLQSKVTLQLAENFADKVNDAARAEGNLDLADEAAKLSNMLFSAIAELQLECADYYKRFDENG